MDRSGDRSMVTFWERLHEQPRFRPRYPHEQVVRWTFRSFDRHGTVKLKVLDLGCGAGRHSLFFASEGFDAYACDISRPALRELQSMARQNNLSIQTQLTEDLCCYDDAFFEGVLSFGVLYYMTFEAAIQSLRAVYRVLKPGGKFLCVTRTNKDGRLKGAHRMAMPFTWRLDAISGNGPSDVEAGLEMLFFPKREIERLFSAFTEVQIDRMTYLHGDFTDDDWVIFATKPAT